MFITKIKSFFKNLLARLLRVNFVIVHIKDAAIDSNKVPNTLYPNRASWLTLNIPEAKIIEFRNVMNMTEHIVVSVNEQLYTFRVVTSDFYYDILSGKLLRVDIKVAML